MSNRLAISLMSAALVWAAWLPAQSGSPLINQGGVTEAAQYLRKVAPGSIATVFGQGFAGGVFEAEEIPLPLELGGVRVEVDGVSAPLYFVSASQINFQIPFETELGEASVTVIRGGVASPAEPVEVNAYAPAAFRNPATGEAIVVEAGTANLIRAENPAVAGQVVTVFLNGFGRLDNTPATGAGAGADPLARTVAVPRVRLGEQEVTVYYAGLAPGFVGLGQLNLGLPAALPAGLQTTLPLSMDFDGFASPIEDLPVELPPPPAHDAGIEITHVTPQSVFPGGSFRVDYMLRTPTGYAGEAKVTFFLQLGSSFATLDSFTVGLTGVDVALSRELTVGGTTFPGSYSLQATVEIPRDGDASNNTFAFATPFVVQAVSGEPHDIGVRMTSVAPAQFAPGDSLTFTYSLLNLTSYRGPVLVTYQLSTPSAGHALLTETITLDGVARDIVKAVPTPSNLPAGSYTPLLRVTIENDTDPSNNVAALFDDPVVASGAASLTPGDPPPAEDLTEGNLSEWQVDAYRAGLPVEPGVRLGVAAPAAGGTFLTGVARWADRLILQYPRAAALEVMWDLSSSRTLELWVSLRSNAALLQGRPRLTLRSPEGSRTLASSAALEQRGALFERVQVPLSGDASWTASEQGAFSIARVTAFEIDFQFESAAETTVSLDGVRFAR